MPLIPRPMHGFTLIEMVVVLVIMAILLGLGLPSYRLFMVNQKLHSTAEVFMASLQMARAEAVKRNQRTEFVMTTDEPTPANVDTATTSPTGPNWIVRVLVPAPGPNIFIEGKSGAEGSGTATAAASRIITTGSIAAVTFDGYGAPINLAADATFDFADPSAGNCAADATPGAVRCQRVILGRSGQARLCDPAAAAGDTRSCT